MIMNIGLKPLVTIISGHIIYHPVTDVMMSTVSPLHKVLHHNDNMWLGYYTHVCHTYICAYSVSTLLLQEPILLLC